jgi:hypothetical protein
MLGVFVEDINTMASHAGARDGDVDPLSFGVDFLQKAVELDRICRLEKIKGMEGCCSPLAAGLRRNVFETGVITGNKDEAGVGRRIF